MSPALDEARRNGISGAGEDHRRNAGGLGGCGARITQGDENLRALRLQLLDQTRQFRYRHCATRREGEISARRIAEIGQRADQDLAEPRIRSYRRPARDRTQTKRRVGFSKRAYGRQAAGADKTEERAPSHSITSVAAASSVFATSWGDGWRDPSPACWGRWPEAGWGVASG